MKAVAQLSEQERKELFSETATAMGITSAAAEKDFWICRNFRVRSCLLPFLTAG